MPDGTYVPVGIIFVLAKVDDGLELGEVPEHEVVLHFFHCHALGLDGLDEGRRQFGVFKARTGATAQLLGAQRGNVHIKETAFDRRGLFENDRTIFHGRLFGGRVNLRDFGV